jgi:hypothetical protein
MSWVISWLFEEPLACVMSLVGSSVHVFCRACQRPISYANISQCANACRPIKYSQRSRNINIVFMKYVQPMWSKLSYHFTLVVTSNGVSALCVCVCVCVCFRVTILAEESNKYYMFWVCVCSLIIRKAMRVRRIILSSVACSALQYFSTLSHKWHDFLKRKSLNIKCVFWFSLQLLSETFLILRRTERGTNVFWFLCKVPVIHVRF